MHISSWFTKIPSNIMKAPLVKVQPLSFVAILDLGNVFRLPCGSVEQKRGCVIDNVDRMQSTAHNRLMYATVINENRD